MTTAPVADDTTIDPSKPSVFFRAGWAAARRAPVVFVARAFFDLATTAVRLVAVVVAVVSLTVHLGVHLQQGGTPLGWLETVARIASRPGMMIGVAGMLFTVWLALMFLEAITNGGIWTVLADGVQGREHGSARDFLRGALSRFPDALKQRLFASVVDATLFSVTIGTVLGAIALSRFVGLASGSAVIAPALVWATVLTLFGLSAGILRLTTEFVAAPMFLEGVGLGEGILRAARTVALAPVRVYRLFVLAAGVLIPPLFLYWAAIMFQNLTLEMPQLQAFAGATRMVAELVLLCGVAGFAVMMHAAFFAYYSWTVGRLDTQILRPAADRKPTRGLQAFLPESQAHTVKLDDVIGGWEDRDVMETREPPSSPPPGDDAPPGEFDLDSILRRTDQEE